MNKKTINDIDVYDKKVIVRVDFNVPVIDGKITDDNRVVEALPTIKYLLEKGAAVILMSHLGRPEGKPNKKYSLKVVADRLKELLPDNKVIMAKDVVGEDAQKKAKALKMYVEPLITKSKVDNTNSRRVVFSYLKQKEAVTELFSEVAPKIINRPGGYTRILKTGSRLGDNAEMCIIELVDYNTTYTVAKAVETKKPRTRRSSKKSAEAQVEAPATEAPAQEA